MPRYTPEPLEGDPPSLADIAGSPTHPPDVLPGWMPHCTLLREDRKRCGRLMYLDVTVLCCKRHQTRWLPDDPRIRWKPPDGVSGESQRVFTSLPADLWTALDRAAADAEESRPDVIRVALANYPPVAFHLGLIRGHPRPEPEIPLVRGAKGALAAARETADELAVRLDAVPLENLHLTDPLYVCLHDAGIKTLGELGALSLRDILAIPEFPLAGLGEVKAALMKFNPLKDRTHRRIEDGVLEAITPDLSRSMPVEKIIEMHEIRQMSFVEIAKETGGKEISIAGRYWHAKNHAVLASPLEGFSEDAKQCFANAGIISPMDLLKSSEDDLRLLAGFRPEMLDQVRKKFVEYGNLRWGTGAIPAELRIRIRDERYRHVLELRETRKLSWNQVGVEMGCSRSVAKGRYNAAVRHREGVPRLGKMSGRVWRELYGPFRVRRMLGTTPAASSEEAGEPSP